MRTRSSSQGGDTTACASSSAGEVSKQASKRRKTAAEEHVDALPAANRPRQQANAEAAPLDAPEAAGTDAQRQPQPATSVGPATAELQGVPAPDPGATSLQDSSGSQPAALLCRCTQYRIWHDARYPK